MLKIFTKYCIFFAAATRPPIQPVQLTYQPVQAVYCWTGWLLAHASPLLLFISEILSIKYSFNFVATTDSEHSSMFPNSIALGSPSLDFKSFFNILHNSLLLFLFCSILFCMCSLFESFNFRVYLLRIAVYLFQCRVLFVLRNCLYKLSLFRFKRKRSPLYQLFESFNATYFVVTSLLVQKKKGTKFFGERVAY